MATFASADLKAKFTNTFLTMYTFGSPRTGNQIFVNYLYNLLGNGAYQRVTHYNDVVPHLPPKVLGFVHAGDEIWYMNDTGDQY